MKRNDTDPILIPARSAVLLVFMPPDRTNYQQRDSLTALTDSLQKLLGESVRLLKIDEATHPDVVQSFAITHTPAFVLVRQGIELWRQVGMPDKETPMLLTQRLMSF